VYWYRSPRTRLSEGQQVGLRLRFPASHVYAYGRLNSIQQSNTLKTFYDHSPSLKSIGNGGNIFHGPLANGVVWSFHFQDHSHGLIFCSATYD
jgi:hypothetical protein